MKKYLIIVAAAAGILAAAVAAVWLSVGLKNEPELAPFKQVMLALEDEDPRVGLEALEHYLRLHPESAQAHLMLANLYDERLDMPLEAIYHYKKYLLLAPDADREATGLWIQADSRKCVEKWLDDHDFDMSFLLDREFVELKNENRELRDQIAAYDRAAVGIPADDPPPAPSVTETAPPPPAPETAPEPTPATAHVAAAEPDGEQLYTVRKGDSLGAISRRFYGDAKYFKVIYEHNRDLLKSPDSLRAGQTLKIPAFTPPPPPPSRSPETQAELARRPLVPIPPLTPEQLRKIRPDAAVDHPATEPPTTPNGAPGRAATPGSAGITPYLYGQ